MTDTFHLARTPGWWSRLSHIFQAKFPTAVSQHQRKAGRSIFCRQAQKIAWCSARSDQDSCARQWLYSKAPHRFQESQSTLAAGLSLNQWGSQVDHQHCVPDCTDATCHQSFDSQVNRVHWPVQKPPRGYQYEHGIWSFHLRPILPGNRHRNEWFPANFPDSLEFVRLCE